MRSLDQATKTALLLSVSLAVGVAAEETSAAEAHGALDYSITVFGPTHVFQGYGVRLGASVEKRSEHGEIIALNVDQLPSGAECSFSFWQGNRVYRQGSGVIHVVTGRDTPTGVHASHLQSNWHLLFRHHTVR